MMSIKTLLKLIKKSQLSRIEKEELVTRIMTAIMIHDYGELRSIITEAYRRLNTDASISVSMLNERVEPVPDDEVITNDEEPAPSDKRVSGDKRIRRVHDEYLGERIIHRRWPMGGDYG